MTFTAEHDYAGGGVIKAHGQPVLAFHKIANGYSGHHKEALQLVLAAPLMLDALKNISNCGLLDCNCGKPCDGTCTYAMVEDALKAVKG